MAQTFYMEFNPKEQPSLDRVGGLPTHMPPYFPISPFNGEELGFLCQIYVNKIRLPIKNLQCLQIYQSVYIDRGDDSVPVAVKVPLHAPLNSQGLGRIHPEVDEFAICWQEAIDPDWAIDRDGNSSPPLEIFRSKLGGTFPPDLITSRHKKILGWITEYPVGFNFGGILVLSLTHDSDIDIEIY